MGGVCVQLFLVWLMEPASVSGVDQFVNKVMHSVVIHDRSVRIKDHSLTVMGPLTSSEWFLNHSGGLSAR